jgi:phage terminase small subunit
MKEKKLTSSALKKYRLIIDEWFNNEFNGKQAYLKFYKNVKAETASTNFSKIQQYKEVQDYIKEKYAFAKSNAEMTQKEIIKNLEAFAELDVTQICNYTDIECTGFRMIENPNYDSEDIESKKHIEEEFKYYRRELVIKDFKELNEIQRKAITSVKQGKFGIEIEFFPKVRAYDMLNRHKGVYEADNQQKQAVINITTSNDKHKALVEGIMNGDI